jgi:hypothetical protein
MFLQTYVRVALLFSALPHAVARRAEAKKAEDGGLATLEWVALAIVAVGLATAAGLALQAVLTRKISEIP